MTDFNSLAQRPSSGNATIWTEDQKFNVLTTAPGSPRYTSYWKTRTSQEQPPLFFPPNPTWAPQTFKRSLYFVTYWHYTMNFFFLHIPDSRVCHDTAPLKQIGPVKGFAQGPNSGSLVVIGLEPPISSSICNYSTVVLSLSMMGLWETVNHREHCWWLLTFQRRLRSSAQKKKRKNKVWF